MTMNKKTRIATEGYYEEQAEELEFDDFVVDFNFEEDPSSAQSVEMKKKVMTQV